MARGEIGRWPRLLGRGGAGAVGLSLLPPAAAALAFERPIERRGGTPGGVALGLLAGSAALLAADRAPASRAAADATARDGLALGLAAATALWPGVSRSGATIAAARACGFRRADAALLARASGAPVIAGAAAFKGWRLARRGVAPGTGRALAAGAAAAFAATLAARPLLLLPGRGPLWPYAAYRTALAALALRAGRG